MSVESGWEKVLPFFTEELQALILDPTISDWMVNGTTGVYADRGGVIEHIPLANEYSVERLEAAIQRVARMMGQDLTHQNPILNTRMPDGSRVAVVGAPSAIGGPSLTIRKFNQWFTTDQLIEKGSIPREARDRVVQFLLQKKNGVIAGGTGSGKTTLMKAILDHVPVTDRLVVIEQVAELRVLQPNVLRWEAVDAIPGQVAILPSALLAASLRHRPDRIIFGEIRDECANDLLQAMNTGHGGTLTTLHAKSAWDALSRLSNLALSARPNINHSFVRSETADAIDFVLYCERLPSGRRRVRELIAVTGYDFATQSFETEDLYRADEPADMPVTPTHASNCSPSKVASPRLQTPTNAFKPSPRTTLQTRQGPSSFPARTRAASLSIRRCGSNCRKRGSWERSKRRSPFWPIVPT